MVKQDDTEGYRAVADVAIGFLVQINDLRSGHYSLTDGLVRENERIVNRLKRKYPNLATDVVRGLEQHITHQKETLREQRHPKR